MHSHQSIICRLKVYLFIFLSYFVLLVRFFLAYSLRLSIFILVQRALCCWGDFSSHIPHITLYIYSSNELVLLGWFFQSYNSRLPSSYPSIETTEGWFPSTVHMDCIYSNEMLRFKQDIIYPGGNSNIGKFIYEHLWFIFQRFLV